MGRMTWTDSDSSAVRTVQAANISATFAKRQADAEAVAAAEAAAALRRARGQSAAAQAQAALEERWAARRLAAQAFQLAEALHKVRAPCIECHPCLISLP